MIPYIQLGLTLEEISRSFREHSTNPVAAYIIGILIVVSLISLGIYYLILPLYQRQQQREKLFRELCDRHHLSPEHTKLLQKVSHKLDLDHPARLFIRKDLLEQASNHIDNPQKLEELQQILFEDVPSN